MKCETIDFLKMLVRMMKAGAKRVGNADEHELSSLYACKLEMDKQLHAAIHLQLLQGKSWTDIGKALGMTRQGAQRRFGH